GRVLVVFVCPCVLAPLDVASFPTRRSSDLATPLERDDNGVVTQSTVADVLVPQARFAVPLREVIVPTIYGEGVDLAPAAIALASVEEMLVPSKDREVVMRGTLDPVLADYDLVLIDCP